MLYQDRLGMLYEIPEGQVYGLGYAEPPSAGEGQVSYDGLGNPVGAWYDSISKAVGGLVGKALPALTSMIPGPQGAILRQALPGFIQGMAPGTPAPAPVAQLPTQTPQPLTSMPYPGPMQAMPGGMMPGSFGMPIARPWPQGWVRPPLPYTGLGPKRLYMRCAVWPGPEGLVPAIAAQAPAAQAQAAGVAAAQTAATMMRPIMRRRIYRRRR